ncbi:Citrate lyase beta chain [Clostridiaceae bacterium JG1575]|nr:Citrate lyase beta chain [Clostridiaceae bacterium JG1575]
MRGLRRSFQFIPANNPGMLMSADLLGADAVIFDLEDAVALTEKDSARDLLIAALQTFPYEELETVVRINPLDTPYGEDDLTALCRERVDAIMVPKATVQSMQRALEVLHRLGYEGSVLPLIETAQGVEEVREILSLDPLIDGMLLGAEDLTSDLGVARTKKGHEIDYARMRCVTACKAQKVTCIDTPWTDAEDLAGLKEDVLYAKSLGFAAKSSINPRHLEVLHEVFAPSEREVVYALRVMEAQDLAQQEGKGVFSLDGKMVDAPIIARAKAALTLAQALGLVKEGEYLGK